MFAVAEVYIGYDVDNAAIGFLRQTLVLTAVAGLHVEDGDMETLSGDSTQAGVGIAEDKQRIGLDVDHQFV